MKIDSERRITSWNVIVKMLKFLLFVALLATIQAAEQACTLGTAGGCNTAVALGLTRQIANKLTQMGHTFKTLNATVIHCSNPCFNQLQAAAADALARAAESKRDYITLNSAFRSSAQQFLLYNWYQKRQCGIQIAAKPGTSNHEGGRAIDTSSFTIFLFLTIFQLFSYFSVFVSLFRFRVHSSNFGIVFLFLFFLPFPFLLILTFFLFLSFLFVLLKVTTTFGKHHLKLTDGVG